MHTIYVQPTKEEYDIIQNNTIQIESPVEPTDYQNKVCVKPWGYEFLTYHSDKMAIWYLNIQKNQGTSLHTHFKKDTFIIVLSGTAKVTFIHDDVMSLPPMSSIFIPKHKFHALSCYSEEVFLMEIEIFDHDVHFSNKNDLLRIDDPYRRSRTGYESSVRVSEEVTNFDYFYLEQDVVKKINQTELRVLDCNDTTCLPKTGYHILLQGSCYTNGQYLREGSRIPNNIHDSFCVLRDCRILSIQNEYAFEDSKLIYSMEHLQTVISQCKKQDKKMILTSGCYDILHVGHIHNLRESKKLGDLLLVCLSNDSQITKLKGPSRPINQYVDRINLFKTISYVDYIILYDEEDIEKEETLGKIMKCVQPYSWVKGSDYTIDKIMEKHPYLHKVILIDNITDKSTTHIIKKITT
uniref:Cytidyltransferase-like domain-containing protein n=1 Tax=viral metagenome TaxID=1070528 RepID=A0A6C0KKS5_9ZZZZ